MPTTYQAGRFQFQSTTLSKSEYLEVFAPRTEGTFSAVTDRINALASFFNSAPREGLLVPQQSVTLLNGSVVTNYGDSALNPPSSVAHACLRGDCGRLWLRCAP
jgi:hypothetical protein